MSLIFSASWNPGYLNVFVIGFIFLRCSADPSPMQCEILKFPLYLANAYKSSSLATFIKVRIVKHLLLSLDPEADAGYTEKEIRDLIIS